MKGLKRISKRRNTFNMGLKLMPLMLLISLAITTEFLKARITEEITNPSLPNYLVTLLSEFPYFFIYILPFFAFFVFIYDFQQESSINVLGVLAGLGLIFSFATGLTSFLSYLIGIFIIAFSSI